MKSTEVLAKGKKTREKYRGGHGLEGWEAHKFYISVPLNLLKDLSK